MSITEAEARERAKAGAKFMDREFPGWFRKINLDILDLASRHDCIMGQTWGEYNHALNTVSALRGVDTDSLIRMGFTSGRYATGSDKLSAAWEAEIVYRRLAGQ